MALTDGDRNWLQGRFDIHSEKIDEFQKEFGVHKLEDQATASGVQKFAASLQAHLDAHEATRRRSRKNWIFWVGVGVAMVSPIIATIIEHWLFAKHIAEKVGK